MITYSINKKLENPFYLCYTSVNKRLKDRLENTRGSMNWKILKSEEHFSKIFKKDKIIYLTADATEEIDKLEIGYCYVIGGIVDRNRYKNLCSEEAKKYGVKTAKFPLKKFVQLKASPVLTVNQCFEIITNYSKLRDWKKVFEIVIPRRKIKLNLEYSTTFFLNNFLSCNDDTK